VAYDERLAERLRELIGSGPDVTEQRMFGGLAFLIGGHLAVAASGQGGLLVRVDPADADDLLASTAAQPMEMRGRPMRGWLRVPADEVTTARALRRWVGLGTAYVRTLPPKG
jgi:TfoX/Sxy family transcriptional regulator of competence genes